jgi:myo-inositol-1(or 4)-monophosphatase
MDEYLNFAIDLAKSSGDLLKKGFRLKYKIEQKEGIHNLVTEYDYLSEKNILSQISERYRDHFILSEEKGKCDIKTSGYQWIVDPLDGTVNFAHGIPVFAVSIALLKDGQVILGVTYQPMTDELFYAKKDQGAFLNNKKLEVSKSNDLQNSYLATGFPYDLNKNPNHCVEKLLSVLKKGIAMRRLGCGTIDLAYVAAGFFDGFFETNHAPWDVAAGSLLIKEAGGKITNWQGDIFDKISMKNTILATNGHLHENILNLFRS